MTYAKEKGRRNSGALTADQRELLAMLAYKRPAGSACERVFIDRFIVPTGAAFDFYGNYWLRIGESPILWTAHTDTVHLAGGMQRVEYRDGVITAPGSDCLGADCTTGCWIMLGMIRARVPGLYCFFREEEIGGRGSSHVADVEPGRLSGVRFAVAFDRKGTNEVITHQMGRTASDAFARSMCEALHPLPYIPSSHGIFTDTQNLAGIVPECSNLGVGYYRAHTSKEWQDMRHATALRARMISADFSDLVSERVPMEPDWRDDWGWETAQEPDLETWVYTNPSSVAEFLEDMGVRVSDLTEFKRRRGVGRW